MKDQQHSLGEHKRRSLQALGSEDVQSRILIARINHARFGVEGVQYLVQRITESTDTTQDVKLTADFAPRSFAMVKTSASLDESVELASQATKAIHGVVATATHTQ